MVIHIMGVTIVYAILAINIRSESNISLFFQILIYLIQAGIFHSAALDT